jgi:hypothetical protein
MADQKKTGFAGDEFSKTGEPPVEVPVVAEVATSDQTEPTELNLDVESRLAAIHNAENP